MGCLYRLTSPSGKQYIGITKHTAEHRWKRHIQQMMSGRGQALHVAMRKYGVENFQLQTLVIADWGYLVELEKRAIAAYGTQAPKGYNLTSGGEGAPGLSGESLAKKLAGHRAWWEANKESQLPRLAEMRGKLREAMADPEKEGGRRERISQTMSDRSSLPENKARLSSIASIVWKDPERRAALLAKRKAIIDAMTPAEKAEAQLKTVRARRRNRTINQLDLDL